MSINHESIVDIENYVNENLVILKNTTYENAAKFKLRPGHKSRDGGSSISDKHKSASKSVSSRTSVDSANFALLPKCCVFSAKIETPEFKCNDFIKSSY